MATWKVVAMVLLVVLPGGGAVLLAIAGYRAFKNRSAKAGRAAQPRRWPTWSGLGAVQSRA